MSSITPFPVLFTGNFEPWRWPVPPFPWHHKAAPAEGILACRLEAREGETIEGEMTAIDTASGRLHFRANARSTVHPLAFSRLRRVTLLEPLEGSKGSHGLPFERLPVAAHQRPYRVHLAGSQALLEGLTLGHVETEQGLFFFTPTPDDQGVLRVMVPREAYDSFELGLTAEEVAAEQWVATPEALLQAVADQARKPVLQIGQSLLELGFVTAEQLQNLLEAPSAGQPLGERLVSSGLVTRSQLQTALAYKMGYPFVDLSRFPIDPDLVRCIPFKLCVKARSLPLMLDGNRLLIAMDRPSRLELLKVQQAALGQTFVPVLAFREQLLAAFTKLNPHDIWSANELGAVGFSETIT